MYGREDYHKGKKWHAISDFVDCSVCGSGYPACGRYRYMRRGFSLAAFCPAGRDLDLHRLDSLCRTEDSEAAGGAGSDTVRKIHRYIEGGRII